MSTTPTPDPNEEQTLASPGAKIYPSNVPPATASSSAPVLAAETTSAASGQSIAEAHIANELRLARNGLNVTRILTSLLTLGVLGYMTFVTTTLSRALEPKAAAEIAQGVIQEKVETQAQEFSGQLKERIPKMVADLPDYALKQIPQYREQLEKQVETDLNQHLTTVSAQLDGHLDDFLGAHKDEIKQMLTDGKDPQMAKALGDQLERDFVKYVSETPVNGETLSAKLSGSLTALQSMDKRMKHLALNKGLTPQEKKARRAIAILTHTIEQKRADGA